MLVPCATTVFKSPSPTPAWIESGFEGRMAYLICTEDKAIPKFGQEAMMQGIGTSWISRDLKGSHSSPFLKKTDEAVDIIEQFIIGFLGTGA